MCANTPASFTCGCRTGYTLMPDGINCVDIDECGLNAGKTCQDTCINTDGSFTCGCRSGFSLASDGKTCSGMCKNIRVREISDLMKLPDIVIYVLNCLRCQ